MKKLLSICSLLFGIIILFIVGFFIYHSPDQPLADENAKPAAIPDFAKAEVIKEAEVITETKIADNTQAAAEIVKNLEKALPTETSSTEVPSAETPSTGTSPTESPEETAIEKNEKNEPETLDTPTYIEQSLIDLLAAYIDNNYEGETVAEMRTGKLLEPEELDSFRFTPEDESISEQIESRGRVSGRHEFTLVDADNDGYDDIVAYLHSGGSMGIVYLIFYQGSEDGIFKETYDTIIGIYSGNSFIRYNGKNYFLMSAIDYDTIGNGYNLYFFADGIIKEHTSIIKMPESYTPSHKTVLSEEYNALADELSVAAPKLYLERYESGSVDIIGSAETELNEQEIKKANKMKGAFGWDFWCKADPDNDSIEEWYSKSLFGPSSVVHFRFLEVDFYKNAQPFDLGLDLMADNKIPWLLWVERVNDKNIVCLLSEVAGDDELILDCYYIQNDHIQTAVKLEFVPNYILIAKVNTHGISRDFISDGANDIIKG